MAAPQEWHVKEAKRNNSYEPTGILQPSGNIQYKRHTVRPGGCTMRHEYPAGKYIIHDMHKRDRLMQLLL